MLKRFAAAIIASILFVNVYISVSAADIVGKYLGKAKDYLGDSIGDFFEGTLGDLLDTYLDDGFSEALKSLTDGDIKGLFEALYEYVTKDGGLNTQLIIELYHYGMDWIDNNQDILEENLKAAFFSAAELFGLDEEYCEDIWQQIMDLAEDNGVEIASIVKLICSELVKKLSESEYVDSEIQETVRETLVDLITSIASANQDEVEDKIEENDKLINEINI